jgi:hypothetical protein
MNHLPPQVAAVGRIHFHGNLHHSAWSQHFRFKNGLVDLVAKEIFADIIYWYRPTEVRNEGGKVVGLRKKFKEDLLQDTYAAIAKRAGLTKRQVQEGMARLEKDYGVVKRVFRNLTIKRGNSDILLSNVLYIDIVPERVLEVSNFTEDPEADVPIEGENEDDVTPITSGRDTPPPTASVVTHPNVTLIETATETSPKNEKEEVTSNSNSKQSPSFFSHTKKSAKRKKVTVPDKLLQPPPPKPGPDALTPLGAPALALPVRPAPPPVPTARANGYIPTRPEQRLAVEKIVQWENDDGEEIPIPVYREPARREYQIKPTDKPASHKYWSMPKEWLDDYVPPGSSKSPSFYQNKTKE